MVLRRGFSTLGCPELSLEAAIALAEKHKLSDIEVRALDGSTDLPASLATAYGTPARLADRLRQSRIRVVAFNVSLRLVGPTAAEREQLIALGSWADGSGVPWIRIFDGEIGVNASAGAAAGETMEWWRALRRQQGWRCDIMVETHDSLFTIEALRRFVTAFPATAILWDAHHTWKKSGEDPVTTWKALRRSVVHVHVKDSVSVPGPRHPYSYVLPGDGEFPIAPLLAALRSDRFDGVVSLEWERLWHPDLPTLDEALTTAAARRWW